MYYNSATDRAVDIEEIARQCYVAITRGRVQQGTYQPQTNSVPVNSHEVFALRDSHSSQA